MDEDESLRTTNFQVDESSATNPYQLLMRQSRKMGHFATRTYDVTKEFLKTDVNRLNTDINVFRKRSPETKESQNNKKNRRIKSIVKQSHEVLACAQTVMMPSNLFPDSVVLDRSKLTITKKNFFWSTETVTIRIEDILNVTSSVGPFFGSITVSGRVMNSTDHYEITNFSRKDAVYLKEVIQGYMIALHSKLETDHLTRSELVNTLIALGRDSEM